MTIKKLKEIISNLPDTTIILIEGDDINEVESIEVQFHNTGETHLIFNASE